MSYDVYKLDAENDIQACLEDMGCQPILFIGSGISKRYFNAPNWEQLLRHLCEICPRIEDDFIYYKQTNSPVQIGKIFADKFRQWAWREGKNEFPAELFHEDVSPDIYIKYKIKVLFDEITPKDVQHIESEEMRSEIEAFQEIRPHALITTNYDEFLELAFPDYTPVIGQQILKTNNASVGEILKIHGCTTDPKSIVLTSDDYDSFLTKKKYLSAKLLTYFAEHPLVFIGYSAEDPNIRAILSDIDEIISTDNQLIPNIYLVEWDPGIESKPTPSREKLISIGHQRSVRVKSIVANSFEWVFKAFGSNGALDKVNPKLLRALLARTYDMVRYDIPKKTVEVNFQVLENAINQEGELAKIYGITTLTNPTALNAGYPYTITQIGNILGFGGWHKINQIFIQIKEQTGTDIKSSDNRYHIKVKVGNSSFSKYSESTIELLRGIIEGNDYTLEP